MARLEGIAHALVDPNGAGHYTTVDAAIDAGEFSIVVKPGSSIAGWTHDVAGVEVELGPGCTVTSAPNRTANNCTQVYGPGCDIQAELDVTTGTNSFTEFMNGCDVDGIDINTARGYVNGGGWGTVVNGGTSAALSPGGGDCIFENIAIQTTAGGGNNADGAVCTGSRDILRLVKVVDSDRFGFTVTSAPSDMLWLGCTIVDADNEAFRPNGPRQRVIGNNIIASSGGEGIQTQSSSDDSVYCGNIVNDTVTHNASADNSAIVGNRIDTTLTNNDGDSTAAANDLTGF